MSEATSDESTDIIDTPEKLHAALDHWKNVTFAKTYIKLDDAVKSMDKPDRLVEGRKDYAARWFLSRPGTKTAATLWTVVVWRWNSDMETGNFVPPGAVAPARLAESRIQSTPGPLCQFSYGVDTSLDASLWEAQKVFENHITSNDKFNTTKKERRNWQDGKDSDLSVFTLTSQIFVKKSAYTRQKQANISYTLHHWIRDATQKSSAYFANDERPEVFESDEGMTLRGVAQNGLRPLKAGDLVWLSFSVEFFIGTKYWVTNFIPYEFVRVGTVSIDLLGDIRSRDSQDVAGPRERLGVGIGGISVSSGGKLGVLAGPSKGPSDVHEVNAASTSTATDSDRNEIILTPDHAWRYRHIELFPQPTTPSDWENSDTERSAECLTDDPVAGKLHGEQYENDQPMEVDDEDVPGSMAVNLTNPVAGVASPIPVVLPPIADVATHIPDTVISISNVSLPVADITNPAAGLVLPVANLPSPVAAVELPSANVSVPGVDPAAPVAEVSLPVHDVSLPSASVSFPMADLAIPVAHIPSSVRKVDDEPPIPSKHAPKPRAKKRAASTERPQPDEGTDGALLAGGRRLRDRRDKGKAVAR